MYSPGIQDLHYNADRLFPRLDDLIDIHRVTANIIIYLDDHSQGSKLVVDQLSRTTKFHLGQPFYTIVVVPLATMFSK